MKKCQAALPSLCHVLLSLETKAFIILIYAHNNSVLGSPVHFPCIQCSLCLIYCHYRKFLWSNGVSFKKLPWIDFFGNLILVQANQSWIKNICYLNGGICMTNSKLSRILTVSNMGKNTQIFNRLNIPCSSAKHNCWGQWIF